MLPITRSLAVLVCTAALFSCGRSNDSKLIGEWNNAALNPTARVTYSADHTYSAHMDHPRDGNFMGAGTWRVDGTEIICRDDRYGESRAQIVKITQNTLQIKGPDGIISTYQRIK